MAWSSPEITPRDQSAEIRSPKGNGGGLYGISSWLSSLPSLHFPQVMHLNLQKLTKLELATFLGMGLTIQQTKVHQGILPLLLPIPFFFKIQ